MKVESFSKMKFWAVVLVGLVLACLGLGCTSVPKVVKYTGGEALEQCPKEFNLDTGERSAALVSVESDLPFDEFYLLLEKNNGAKYLMELRPRKLSMPTGGEKGHGFFKANPFCYDISPGNYNITKVIGVFRSTGPAGGMSEKIFKYEHTREFEVPLNRVSYLGRYILLDTRMKDKGTFGRMGKMISGMFTGSIVPNDIEINIVDSIDEDLVWMLEKHKKVRIEQVIKTVH